MNGRTLVRVLRSALVAACAPIAFTAWAEPPAAPAEPAAPPADLETAFRDPPQSARPRVWWHWMNGNISKDGIAKDLAWMKRVGIGGLQNFDADLRTPQIVDRRLIYMTPAWKDAFRFAATEADRLGLELAIAASPGWSETGGPWVPPEDGLKKLVWSETSVSGGKRFTGVLAKPPGVTGPFQSMPMQPGISEMISGEAPKPGAVHYGDVAVLAVPVAGQAAAVPGITLADGTPIDAAKLLDGDLTTGVTLARGSKEAPATLLIGYDKPQAIRSASIFIPGAKMQFVGATVEPVLEASDDGVQWRKVSAIPVADVPTTISFAPVTARRFRIVLEPLAPMMSNMGAPSPGIAFPEMFAAMGASGAKPWTVRELGLSTEARIDQFETKAGFALTMDYFALATPADGAQGSDPARVIDLTARMKADGSLDWTPPKGNWRVLRFGYSLLGTTNHPAPPEATGLEVDKFDGAAVRRYMEHYIGMYRDAAGAELIGKRGVQAILTDSIEVGAANWTPRMIERFKALRGYDPTPWLPAVAGTLIGTRAQSDRFLFDYRRTLADLMASEHYGTVAAVAHESGLKVYGEALEDKRPSLGDDMAMRRHADVPMAAMWTYPQGGRPNPSYLADIKGAASVAHIYGQNLVAAESMTSALTYWNDSPASLKHIIDQEFVAGVNRPVIHTSVHQPRDDKFPGLSLMIFGQYFNRHEAWAEMAKPWVDYLARNSLMLQQGRNVADVGYFHGEEAPLTGLYGLKPVADAPVASAYDFVNADALAGALRNDGAELVTPGGARYRALYLGGSSRRMTLATLRRIAALAEGGATIVGLPPEADPGLAGDAADYAALVAKLWPAGGDARVGNGRVIASADIEAALRTIGVAPDFRYTGGEPDGMIPFVHRKLADGDSYFLVNQRDRTETIDAHFRVTGKAPDLWRAETGKTEAVGYRIENGETIVPLTLAAGEAVHVVFRRPARADALAIKRLEPVALAQLDGPWTISFQPGRGAPASASMATLAPLDANANPAIRYFSGIATYAKDFVAPKGWRPGEPLWIDLGGVHELAEVVVNGRVAGAPWHAPFRADIGDYVTKGRNRLEVRVANLWVNRLIGDAQPDAKALTWTALPAYRKDAPLRPSGLIGPVTLMGQAK